MKSSVPLLIAVFSIVGVSAVLGEEVVFKLDDKTSIVMAANVKPLVSVFTPEGVSNQKPACDAPAAVSTVYLNVVLRRGDVDYVVTANTISDEKLSCDQLILREISWMKDVQICQGDNRIAVAWVRKVHYLRDPMLFVEMPSANSIVSNYCKLNRMTGWKSVMKNPQTDILFHEFAIDIGDSNIKMLDADVRSVWFKAGQYRPTLVRNLSSAKVDGVEYWDLTAENHGTFPEEGVALKGLFRAKVGQCFWEQMTSDKVNTRVPKP